MSSIYRKGRDGYFYYQTYIYNPLTKKKNKRIFHSLGTKNRDEAIIKQNFFDKKYQKKPFNLKKYVFKTIEKSYFLMTIFTFTVLIYMLTKEDEITEKLQIKESVLPQKKNHTINTFNGNKKSRDEELKSEVLNLNIKKLDSEPIENVSMPDYIIKRSEKVSGIFEQAKLYITVNEQISSKQQLILCKYLNKKYSEYANIVISIYADTKVGNSIAKGDVTNFSRNEIKNNWLALYTYNSVEGEYFDSTPSNYLGLN